MRYALLIKTVVYVSARSILANGSPEWVVANQVRNIVALCTVFCNIQYHHMYKWCTCVGPTGGNSLNGRLHEHGKLWATDRLRDAHSSTENAVSTGRHNDAN